MSDINKKIAQLQGFTVEKLHSGYWQLLKDGLRDGNGEITELDAWNRVPDYENDLNAAWPLLNEMFKNGAGIENNIRFILELSYESSQSGAKNICQHYIQWKEQLPAGEK